MKARYWMEACCGERARCTLQAATDSAEGERCGRCRWERNYEMWHVCVLLWVSCVGVQCPAIFW